MKQHEINWLALIVLSAFLSLILFFWLWAFRNPVRGATLLLICYTGVIALLTKLTKKEDDNGRTN